MSSKLINQSIILYGATILSLVLSFLISMTNTRILSVDDFGALKLIQQIFTFFSIIMSIGISYSLAKLLTISKRTTAGLLGAGFIFYILIAILSMVIIYILAVLFESILPTNFYPIVILFAPFVLITIFTPVLNNVLQGLNKIHLLAGYKIMPQFLYLISIFFYMYFFEIGLNSVVLLTFTTLAIVTTFCCIQLRPSFTTVRKSFRLLVQENAINGIHVYFGSVVALGSGSLLGIILGIYVDMKSLGFYTLALMLATTLQMLPSIIATSAFKSFTKQSKIPEKIIISSVLISLSSLIIFYLLIEELVIRIYPESFIPVIIYAKILAVGAVFHGFGDIFNRFLSAHSKGVDIRNGAFISGLSIVLLGFLLLPIYEGVGAAFVKMIGSLIYFLTMIFYYYKNTINKKIVI